MIDFDIRQNLCFSKRPLNFDRINLPIRQAKMKRSNDGRLKAVRGVVFETLGFVLAKNRHFCTDCIFTFQLNFNKITGFDFLAVIFVNLSGFVGIIGYNFKVAVVV